MEDQGLARIVELQGDLLDEHTKLLKAHEDEFKRMKEENATEFQSMKGAIDMLSTSIESSLKQVNKTNEYLRKQNDKILDQIIAKQTNDFELKKLKWGNAFKIGLAIFSSGGIAYLVIQFIIEIYKTK